ncbi:MAG: DUF1559 domain-containing protein [bacterium]|nr:DUF1559 domain-containing protein [bacterium]
MLRESSLFLSSKKGATLGGFIAWGMLLLLAMAVTYPVINRRPCHDYRRATCQSNLKQLGLAAFMYMQDWDEQWMPSKGWASEAVLGNYVKNDGVFDCPFVTGTTTMQIDYEYNIHVAGTKNKNFAKDTSTVLCMADSKPVNRAADRAGTEFHYPHSSGMNVLFCDCHVKWVRKGRDSQAYSLRIK